MKAVTVKAIVVEAAKGVSVDQALWDALEIAVINKEVVEMEFNGKITVIDPNRYIKDLLQSRASA